MNLFSYRGVMPVFLPMKQRNITHRNLSPLSYYNIYLLIESFHTMSWQPYYGVPKQKNGGQTNPVGVEFFTYVSTFFHVSENAV